MPGLCQTHVLLRSEHQRDLLRRLATGETVNETPDWPDIIEEFESVGSEQRFAVESPPLQALRHMLKAEAWPQSTAVPHWQAEAILFRGQAQRRFTPSMRGRTDLAKIHRKALRAVLKTIDGQPPLPVLQTCQCTLDGLLAED
nr:DUF29 family protein [uncultured Rhodopila sp.]